MGGARLVPQFARLVPQFARLVPQFARLVPGRPGHFTALSAATWSVFSQVNSGSLRPKCPYAAVFE